MAQTPHILLVHHFPLAHITGVTVMSAEILRYLNAEAKETAAYLSYPPTAEELLARLDRRHTDAAAVIGINLHIEVQWAQSRALLAWCRQRKVPIWIYIHDYWPHHFKRVAALLDQGARLLASTRFIQASLAADGFPAEVLAVGVPLPQAPAPAQPSAWPDGSRCFASAGRLAPRKRFYDIVRAFREAVLGDRVGLYLRLLPSRVFDSEEDAGQLQLVEKEISPHDRMSGRVRVERTPSAGAFDYTPYFAYVCASSYEGFSMSPIEAAFTGCPPLMSAVPAHRAIAETLFRSRAEDFLYPVGNTKALAALMRHEVQTEQRRRLLARNRDRVRATIEKQWSLAATARRLAALVRA